MRFAFRADSSLEQGTGHVMRCLTLAEELTSRGHDVHLFTRPISTDWLRTKVEQADVTVHHCAADMLSLPTVLKVCPDWLVVDSYRISAQEISKASESVPVLAVIDGTERSIDATLYLDQNLGAEDLYRHVDSDSRYLVGPSFSLIRKAILSARRRDPSTIASVRPSVLCFMGGTDPSGSIVQVVRAMHTVSCAIQLTIVAPYRLHGRVKSVLPYPGFTRLLTPTPDLPRLLSDADVVVTAAGTSAWDVCALGIPAVLVAVAENQQLSLHEAVSRGLTLGVDAVAGGHSAIGFVGELVDSLLSDGQLRARLSHASLSVFDGQGASRVAQRLELAADEIS